LILSCELNGGRLKELPNGWPEPATYQFDLPVKVRRRLRTKHTVFYRPEEICLQPVGVTIL